RRVKPVAATWPGTWTWPMLAPRRLLPAAGLPTDHAQRLVEDRQPGEGGVLFDRERGVDADRGRIAHRGEPATQTLLIERLRDRLGQRLLRGPIAPELHAENQTLASHLAHAPLLLLHRLAPRHHHLAH